MFNTAILNKLSSMFCFTIDDFYPLDLNLNVLRRKKDILFNNMIWLGYKVYDIEAIEFIVFFTSNYSYMIISDTLRKLYDIFYAGQ